MHEDAVLHRKKAGILKMRGRVQRKTLGLAQRVPELHHILLYDPGELTQVCME